MRSIWKKNSIRRELPGVYPRLWRFCYSLTGERTRADELTQATCMRALERESSFEPGTHLDRWLLVMARRLWLNMIRADKVRRGEGLLPVEETDLPANSSDADTNIFAREVFAIMDGLPEAQRTASLLVLAEGYSYAEAAEALEIPVGTVMSRVAAARRSLVERTGEVRTMKKG